MATLSIEELFSQLIEKNDFWSANLLLKNSFNRNVEDVESFKRFFDFSLKVARWNINLDSRITFLEQAKSGLIIFSENVDINDDILKLIQSCQKEIAATHEDIEKIEQELVVKKNNEIQQNNINLLSKLIDCKMPLQNCSTQEQFHELLIDIKNTEELIQVSYLDVEQKSLFDDLTKEYPELIKNKLNEIERKRLREYNKTAVAEFNAVFGKFKNNEDKYKNNLVELKRLVANRLFIFEADQLYNETLIFYNHVYSYIFGSLDEEGKYRLTELAIDTEKKR